MTTPTPADAVRAAIDALRHATDEEIGATVLRVAADKILPRPAKGDQSPQAVRDRLLVLQFLETANTLAGNPPPAASQEALAGAREESQAAAWQGIEPEQVLPAVEALAAAIGSTPSAPALPPAIAYECGDGVRIEATNHERTSWVVRDSYWCLNSNGEWESDYSHLRDDADFLARTRWPSAKAAWAALLECRAERGGGSEGPLDPDAMALG